MRFFKRNRIQSFNPSLIKSSLNEHLNRRKADRKKVKARLKKNFRKFCTSTSLHGFNYLVKEGVSHRERLTWAFILGISSCTALILLYWSTKHNDETPTITVIESTHFPAMYVPFPAVTICSLNKFSKQRTYQFAAKMIRPDNVTVDELVKLLLLGMDATGFDRKKDKEYLKVGHILQMNNLTALDYLQGVAPKCEDMLASCSWKGVFTKCRTIFQTINTTEGFCCSFNYHGLKINRFPKSVSLTVPKVPYRTLSCGYEGGLTVLLNPMIDDYFGTFLSSYGFRILIHDSYDYPDPNAETKVVSINSENFISITPTMTYATKAVATLDPVDRRCLFHNERQLSVMKRYSFINCLAECRAKFVYDICGCIPTRFLNNDSLPACKMERIFCILENFNMFVGAIPGLNESILQNNNYDPYACGCLPDCEFNSYPAEISPAVLLKPSSRREQNLLISNQKLELKNEVIVHVYFSDLVTTKHRRDRFQNWISLIATFGGLLGLIMGFSIVAGFEFLYYLTVRPIFDHFSNENNKDAKTNEHQPAFNGTTQRF